MVSCGPTFDTAVPILFVMNGVCMPQLAGGCAKHVVSRLSKEAGVRPGHVHDLAGSMSLIYMVRSWFVHANEALHSGHDPTETTAVHCWRLGDGQSVGPPLEFTGKRCCVYIRRTQNRQIDELADLVLFVHQG